MSDAAKSTNVQAGNTKSCTSCGSDVSTGKRYRDAVKGHYFCQRCYMRLKAAGSVAPVGTSTASGKPSDQPAAKTKRCKQCSVDLVHRARYRDQDGTYLCEACMAPFKHLATKTYRPSEPLQPVSAPPAESVAETSKSPYLELAGMTQMMPVCSVCHQFCPELAGAETGAALVCDACLSGETPAASEPQTDASEANLQVPVDAEDELEMAAPLAEDAIPPEAFDVEPKPARPSSDESESHRGSGLTGLMSVFQRRNTSPG